MSKQVQKINMSVVTERKSIRVPFFKDEYAVFGINDDCTLQEACALIRNSTGLVIGARARSGGGVSSLTKAYKNATEEQKAEIAKILSKV